MNQRRNHTPPPSSAPPALILDGIAGSPGLAIGRAVVIDTRQIGVPRRHVRRHEADDELSRYDAAVKVAAQGLREVAEKLRGSAARAETSILEAYVMMVEDEALRDEVARHVTLDLQCAEWAVHTAVTEMARQLQTGGDAYLAERSHDVEFVGERILRAFSGRPKALSIPDLDEPSIIVARDLSPAETAGFAKGQVLGMVTEIGTRTSHTSILARALEIPAVVGVGDILSRVGNGDPLVVDGLRGRVIVSPTVRMVDAAKARAERFREQTQGRQGLRKQLAQTKDGERIKLRANIELPNEVDLALEEGAEGIGLYRTEFLYVDRAEPPSEEEQYDVYRRVLQTAAPLPVTLRTFDIGGDKYVSAFQVPSEMNPALGLRAIRLGLARPDLFLEQLRAMWRASVHGELRIMLPMVATVGELRAVSELVQRAAQEVDAAGHERVAQVPLGIMIEVPAAALMAEELAREAEFMSIGTNDLVQYALAVDRTSRELAYLASPFDPAILRLINNVIAAGRAHERAVTVCGAMASDPFAAVLLVGMGLRELSLEASALTEVKQALSRVTVGEAQALVTQIANEVSAPDVERILRNELTPRFGDLLQNHDD